MALPVLAMRRALLLQRGMSWVTQCCDVLLAWTAGGGGERAQDRCNTAATRLLTTGCLDAKDRPARASRTDLCKSCKPTLSRRVGAGGNVSASGSIRYMCAHRRQAACLSCTAALVAICPARCHPVHHAPCTHTYQLACTAHVPCPQQPPQPLWRGTYIDGKGTHGWLTVVSRLPFFFRDDTASTPSQVTPVPRRHHRPSLRFCLAPYFLASAYGNNSRVSRGPCHLVSRPNTSILTLPVRMCLSHPHSCPPFQATARTTPSSTPTSPPSWACSATGCTCTATCCRRWCATWHSWARR